MITSEPAYMRELPPDSPIRQRWASRLEREAEQPDSQQYCTLHQVEAMLSKQRFDIEQMIQAVPSAHTLIEFISRPLRDRIDDLEEDNKLLRRALGRYAITECGEVPPTDLLTYLKAQVWHSPWLTKEEQKTKSIWSLRLSVEVANHRLPEEINVRLFPLKQFLKTAKKTSMHDKAVMQACDYLMDKGACDESWAGYIQGFTRKKGRPYVKDQAAFLVHAEQDTSPTATQARLTFILAEQLHCFSQMRPANGEAGSALWWCEWRPVKSEAANE
jgi:hypothetical protein